MEEPKKKKRGCVFYGCLGVTLMMLVVLLTAYLGFRFAVERFTDREPLPLPKTQLSGEEMNRLRERVAAFNQAIEANRIVDPLAIGVDEANALIQSEPGWSSLKDQIYVSFESNQLKAQISIPAEKLGSIRLRGRYLNAAGTFTVGMSNGVLQVNALALSAKGRPVPENVMRHVRFRNFALGFTNAEANDALDKLKDIRIQDGKLIIVPKTPK